MKNKPIANVICIKWGTAYGPKDVNRLYGMVGRNIHKHDLHFHCFTEDTTGLNKAIITHPLPKMACPPRYAYQKEAGLCDDNLGGLKGQRVLFFDLDVVITGSVDEMIDFPQGDDFVIINDWNTKGDHVGQATCYSWKVGTLGFVKDYYEKHADEVVDKFYTASQEYLSSMVIQKWGKLIFWPDAWCTSFKFHALPPWYMRPFVTSHLPSGTKVLAFHGHPKIDEAIKGVWADDGVPFYKRIYKTFRPSPWIAAYWRE